MEKISLTVLGSGSNALKHHTQLFKLWENSKLFEFELKGRPTPTDEIFQGITWDRLDTDITYTADGIHLPFLFRVPNEPFHCQSSIHKKITTEQALCTVQNSFFSAAPPCRTLPQGDGRCPIYSVVRFHRRSRASQRSKAFSSSCGIASARAVAVAISSLLFL